MKKDDVQKLIGERVRVKDLIEQMKRENRSPLDVFEQFVSEMLQRSVESVRPIKGRDYFTEDEIRDFLEAITPQKGVHYFDGEDSTVPGPQGEKGDRGERGPEGKPGNPGKDGKNISPETAKLLMAGLLKELTADDIGALTEDGAKKLLEKYDKKSSKSLEKRLNALQDAVMRNYGGHGGSRVFAYDLSSQLNGSTKTFTIDNHSKIVQVTSSSAPFVFRPTIDFTETSTSITFTSGIDAPSMLSAGQSIIILMIP